MKSQGMLADSIEMELAVRWPALAEQSAILSWLRLQTDLGLAPRTIAAYAFGLVDFLGFCAREKVDAATASRADVARYARDLAERPNRRGPNVIALDSGVGVLKGDGAMGPATVLRLAVTTYFASLGYVRGTEQCCR